MLEGTGIKVDKQGLLAAQLFFQLAAGSGLGEPESRHQADIRRISGKRIDACEFAISGAVRDSFWDAGRVDGSLCAGSIYRSLY